MKHYTLYQLIMSALFAVLSTLFILIALTVVIPYAYAQDSCIHPNGQSYQDHWLACSDSNSKLIETSLVLEAQRDYALMELNTCLNPPVPENPLDTICESRTSISDGPGGRLWKYPSDNTGRAVLLMPANYWDIQFPELYTPDGEQLPNMNPRTCCPNGNRAHYDYPLGIGDNQPVVVKFEGECFNVNMANERQD